MVTGGVKVQLDRERTLRYTTSSFIRLEEETGLAFLELQERINAGSLRAIVATLWAGMLHAEPNLTMTQAAERVDLKRLGGVAEKLNEAITHALGEDEGKEGEAGDEGNAEASA